MLSTLIKCCQEQAKVKFAFWQHINLPKAQEIFKYILDVPHEKLLLFVILLFEKLKLNNMGVRSNSRTDRAYYCIIMTLLSAVFWNHCSFRRNKYLTDTCQSLNIVLTLDQGGLGRLTNAGRKGFVPHTPVPTQTSQCAAAVETVSRVAWVQNMCVGEMAVILDFVAIAGDAGFLTADKVKTWKVRATMETGI